MMRSVTKLAALVLALAVICVSLVSCTMFEEFKVYSCGSGFYFNRSDKKSYEIKELSQKSDGNYFYLEDYFYSEELGKEYKIKGSLFNVGSVYLAKKSDHYNPEVYTFELMDYHNGVLRITKDMNYVELVSDRPDENINAYILIEERELPLDITFNNVSIATEWGIPVIFSAAFTDINIILKGENFVESITPSDTVAEFAERVKGAMSVQEQAHYEALEEIKYLSDSISGKNSSGDVAHHYFTLATGALNTWTDVILGGIENIFSGKEGAKGMDGASAIVHPCGISVYGDGSLSIKGGSGASGGDAGTGIFGTSDGGAGGNGGSGISCANFLDASGNITAEGGIGGNGGAAANGLIGSGNNGSKGKDASAINVSNPRKEK